MKINPGIQIELEKLIETRLLIQAQSGAGKSYLLRVILELTNKKIQQIIIDREGEYYTLREKHDYILIGGEGEIPVNLRHVETLCYKLLENKISAIIDLSETPHRLRNQYVKLFSEALLDAPKELRHPLMYVIDEAHLFCPETGRRRGKKNVDSDSTDAIIDVCSQGRKRGICTILATQRITKLNNDAIAEIGNRIFGRTTLDLDIERVGKELGLKRSDYNILRELEAGEFYTFGPAISNTVKKFHAKKAQTTHPKSAGQLIEIPPLSTKAKNDLIKLGNISEEAEKEIKTKEDMRKKITELEIEVAKKPTPEKVEVINPQLQKQYDDLLAVHDLTREEYDELYNEFKEFVDSMGEHFKNINTDHEQLKLSVGGAFNYIPVMKEKLVRITSIKEKLKKDENAKVTIITKKKAQEYIPPPPTPKVPAGTDSDVKIKKGAEDMLGVLRSHYPKSLSKAQIGLFTGYKISGGTFKSYLSILKTNGLIELDGNNYRITEQGMHYIGDNYAKLPKGREELIAFWKPKLKAGAGDILQHIANNYPHEVTKDYLGDVSGFTVTGGTFKSYLSILKTAGLINVNGDMVSLSENMK